MSKKMIVPHKKRLIRSFIPLTIIHKVEMYSSVCMNTQQTPKRRRGWLKRTSKRRADPRVMPHQHPPFHTNELLPCRARWPHRISTGNTSGRKRAKFELTD